MEDEVDGIDAQAARWHAAQSGDAMDWDGFTAWLEADPRHRAAFDAIALLDDRISAPVPRSPGGRMTPSAQADVARSS